MLFCKDLIILLGLHTSARRSALSKFGMPAMSPTMTEGGISSWKKKEGETFEAGDVLLEVVWFPFILQKLGRPMTWFKSVGNGQGYDRCRSSGGWYSGKDHCELKVTKKIGTN